MFSSFHYCLYPIKRHKFRFEFSNYRARKHLRDLRPNSEVQARPTAFLDKLIKKFKAKHGLGDNVHTDLEPGEK